MAASILGALLLVPGAGACADTVTIQPVDVDGDREPEREMQNRYLRVVVHVPQGRSVDKYDVRFLWGGWIEQILFKPGRLEYLGNPVEGRSMLVGLGLPEEFERPVFVDRDEGGERWLRIGVGLIRRAKDAPDKRELIEAPPWSCQEATLPGGGRGLRFAHSVGPVAGVGYHYEKEIALDPDSAALRVRVGLQNTGSKPLETEWYTHIFAAPGGYGPDCWHEIPYRVGTGDAAIVEKEAHAISDLAMGPAHSLWGWLTPAEIGASWYAVGNTRTGHFLAGALSDQLLRVRTWMNYRTYCPEPFLAVRLEPGQTKHWEVLYLCGQGLDALSGVGAGGALRIEPGPDGLRPRARSTIRVRYVPDRPRRRASWQAEAEGPDGRPLGRWHGTFRSGAPDRPASATLRLTAPAGRTRVRVAVLSPREGGAPLVTAEQTFLVGAPQPTAHRRHQGHGERVLLVSGAKAGEAATHDVAYLESYLRWAGLRPEVAGPVKLSESPLDAYACILVPGAGLGPLAPEQASALVRFVAGGGGLVHTAPLSLLSGDAAAALPVTGPAAPVESAQWRFFYGPGAYPQEGAMADVAPHRVHLRKAKAHPVVDDLALYPDAPQQIARYERVTARPDARVLLTFTGSDAPALVLGRHAKGRVAVFCAPVAWGEPVYWMTWGRFGEYQRKLFAETALWAAGLVP